MLNGFEGEHMLQCWFVGAMPHAQDERPARLLQRALLEHRRGQEPRNLRRPGVVPKVHSKRYVAARVGVSVAQIAPPRQGARVVLCLSGSDGDRSVAHGNALPVYCCCCTHNPRRS